MEYATWCNTLKIEPPYLHETYTFSGTPYEVGYQRGRQFKDMIQAYVTRQSAGVLDDLDSWPKPEDYNLDWLKENNPPVYNEYKNWAARTPDWLNEEIRGMAEGARVSYDKLLINDRHYPFIVKARESPSNPRVDRESLNCTSFIAFGKATAGGKVLSGGSREANSLLPLDCIKRIRTKGMNNVVLYARDPWSARGLWGMNDKGLSVAGNGISIVPEAVGHVGYVLIFIRILLQECDTVDEAVDRLRDAKMVMGHHWYMADKKEGVCVDFNNRDKLFDNSGDEFIPGASPIYTNPKFRKWNYVIYDETDPNWGWHNAAKRGVYRLDRFRELYSEKRPLKLSDIPLIQADHGGRGSGVLRQEFYGSPPQGSDFTICVHGRNTRPGNIIQGVYPKFHMTCCAHIEDHDNLKMYMAWGSPCEAGYVPYTPPSG